MSAQGIAVEGIFGAEDAAEKRSTRRQRVLLAGKLVMDHGLVMDCTVRDISQSGARLLVPDSIAFPDRVQLLVMRQAVVYSARPKWSKPPHFGLEFLGAEDLATSNKPGHSVLRRMLVDWQARQGL